MNTRSTKVPKVSVVSISYNQEEFISQALDSFVMQKTDFVFEVIIADDHSTDKTPDIIADYAKRFPNIIKPVLRKENLGIQRNIMDAMQRATGEYLALCEGDDFWTDPSKLQQQADFLDAHKDHNVVFHPVRVFYDNGEQDDTTFPDVIDPKEFTVKKLLVRNFIQTNSVMYRKKTYETMPLNILPLDWYLHLFHAKNSKIGFINRVMSVYRRHPGGVWWGSDKSSDELYKKHGIAHASLYNELLNLYTDAASARVISKNIVDLMDVLLNVDERQGSRLVYSVTQKFPQFSLYYIVALKNRLEESNIELQKLNEVYRKDHAAAEEESARLNDEIDRHSRELEHIKSSRFWKARNRAVKLIGRE